VINYSDQRNRRGGEEMSSEKEDLKTSISIISVNSCNQFLHAARQEGREKR
jgi:hypothetical protein